MTRHELLAHYHDVWADNEHVYDENKERWLRFEPEAYHRAMAEFYRSKKSSDI